MAAVADTGAGLIELFEVAAHIDAATGRPDRYQRLLVLNRNVLFASNVSQRPVYGPDVPTEPYSGIYPVSPTQYKAEGWRADLVQKFAGNLQAYNLSGHCSASDGTMTGAKVTPVNGQDAELFRPCFPHHNGGGWVYVSLPATVIFSILQLLARGSRDCRNALTLCIAEQALGGGGNGGNGSGGGDGNDPFSLNQRPCSSLTADTQLYTIINSAVTATAKGPKLLPYGMQQSQGCAIGRKRVYLSLDRPARCTCLLNPACYPIEGVRYGSTYELQTAIAYVESKVSALFAVIGPAYSPFAYRRRPSAAGAAATSRNPLDHQLEVNCRFLVIVIDGNAATITPAINDDAMDMHVPGSWLAMRCNTLRYAQTKRAFIVGAMAEELQTTAEDVIACSVPGSYITLPADFTPSTATADGYFISKLVKPTDFEVDPIAAFKQLIDEFKVTP